MFELCCWQRFRLKGAVVWVRIGPALQDGPHSDQERRMRSCTLSKKNLVCSVPGQGLSPGHLRSHDGICWTLLNKRELVKSDVEVARLKARLGQTDGLLGALLVANPFAAWAHDFQIRNEKDPQSFRNVLLLHFPNIFQTRTAQRATYFVLPHSVAA